MTIAEGCADKAALDFDCQREEIPGLPESPTSKTVRHDKHSVRLSQLCASLDYATVLRIDLVPSLSAEGGKRQKKTLPPSAEMAICPLKEAVSSSNHDRGWKLPPLRPKHPHVRHIYHRD